MHPAIEPVATYAPTGARDSRRLLLLARDPDALAALRGLLERCGYRVSDCANTLAALQAMGQEAPDLVMLDLDVPGSTPGELIGLLRTLYGAQRPRVLLLSTHPDESQLLAGFDAGTDDYVSKPYSGAELLARVRALLRGQPREDAADQVLEFHELQLSGRECRVTARGVPVAMRGSEYRLLGFLMRNAERTFTRAQLLDGVWEADARVGELAVNVTIQRLRAALARHRCSRYVQTVRGVGYRLSGREP